MKKRLLVAGVGNIFLGDDGFGVAVAQHLTSRPLPVGVDVIDFGIRGIDLAFALEDYDAAILIDTVSRGGSPGTLYVLEPEAAAATGPLEMHSMTPDRVLTLVGPNKRPAVLRVVGCEPATFGVEGVGERGLSPAVEAAVANAADVVTDLVGDILQGDASRA